MAAVAKDFLRFVNGTGSPYHSVKMAEELLLKPLGAVELKEGEPWGALERKRLYFVKRNGSSILAFRVGEGFEQDHGAFKIVAGHTDSPCLRVRPRHNISKENVLQVGVETYGGGLWHTWLDRGLGFAGKVTVAGGRSENPTNGRRPEQSVVDHYSRVDAPVMFIPNLAIHLQTAEERQVLKLNKETHLQPVIDSSTAESEESTEGKGPEAAKREDSGAAPPAEGEGKEKGQSLDRFSQPLLRIVADSIKVRPEDILDLDLCLMDATPSRFCGAQEAFIESPRLDNQVSTFAAFRSLASGAFAAEGAPPSTNIDVAVAFDHEEIGSETWTGANSSLLETWLKRLLLSVTPSCPIEEIFSMVMSRSFLISADMAHAVHPNYPEKHQAQHKPLINRGVVLKENANFRYASQSASMAAIRCIAKTADVPLQDFVVRNDSPCGSTVGPMLNARLGVRTIDLGVPQWGMHSCREICGAADLQHIVRLFESFYGSDLVVKEAA